MKNGVFITDVLDPDLMKTSGVAKKIIEQVSALNIKGQMTCRILCLPKLPFNHIILFFVYLLFDIYKELYSEISSYDYIYIRRIIPLNRGLINLLKRCRNNKSNCKIVYELPTYPYDKEHKTIKARVVLFVDRIFRKELKNYINKIVTLSDDSVIFYIPTIKIVNGINCKDIQIRTPANLNDTINLIAVAHFAQWHGYERLIEGLNNYYNKSKPPKEIYIHFVGDGPELNFYKKLVLQYNLSEYVIFCGLLSEEKLTGVFNKANIAVCSLGAHRIGISLGSFLKSREYLARGIPMISSTKIDVLPPEFKYCYYVPEDESPIVIQDIVKFYQNLVLQKNNIEMTNEIRQFAESNCDMSKTMHPVIEYLDG